MLFDWFTLLAQLVNFLLLVLILHRFLFRPIVAAVRRREEKIQADLDDAATAREEAQAKMRELEAEREDLAERKRKELEDARADAARYRDEALAKVKAEAAAKREEYEAALAVERERFAEQLGRRVASESLALTRKVVSDLLGTDGDSQDDHLAELFVARFLDMLRTEGVVRLGNDISSVSVRTSFDPAPFKDRIAKGVASAIPSVQDVTVEAAPELALGLSLRAGDKTLDFTLDRYMDGLEERVFARLLPARAAQSPASESA